MAEGRTSEATGVGPPGSCPAHSGVVARVTAVERDRGSDREENMAEHAKLWEAMEAVRNRPPAWAVAVIGCLCAALGAVGGSVVTRMIA